MCGVVEVANIVNASVKYVFTGNKMSLSFEAKALAGAAGGGDVGEGGEEGSIQRYRTELMLIGGVDVTKVRTSRASL